MFEKLKKALLISPHFPPATLAGVHRVRHLANRLPEHGWLPIVISVHEDYYSENIDLRLSQLVAPTVTQIKVKALPEYLTRLIGVSDISLRGYASLRAAVKKAVAIYSPEVVFITGAPYYHMLLTGWIAKSLNLPVVLDFQDPWVSAWGYSLPRMSKGGVSHTLSTWLEPVAVKSASFITSVSDVQNDEMRKRYEWLKSSNMAGIPIGGDAADFRALFDGGELQAVAQKKTSSIVYVGSMWPKAEPVVDRLCCAIRDYAENNRDVVRSGIRFVGTDPRLSTAPKKQLVALFEKYGLDQFVDEEPARLPYLDALQELVNARALILFGSEEVHYTSSKIYPVLMSGRPFLSIYHEDSSAHKILSKAENGIAIGFKSLADLDAKVPQIVSALERLSSSAEEFPKCNPDLYAEFLAVATAKKYADIFNHVVEEHSRELRLC